MISESGTAANVGPLMAHFRLTGAPIWVRNRRDTGNSPTSRPCRRLTLTKPWDPWRTVGVAKGKDRSPMRGPRAYFFRAQKDTVLRSQRDTSAKKAKYG